MDKTVFGLNENIAAALANATFGLFGVVALISERENKFVRFHAMQAIIVFFGLSVISGVISLLIGVFGSIPLIGWLLSMPFGIVRFVLLITTVAAWIYLTLSAYAGKMTKVPMIGDAVLSQVEK